MKAKVFFTVHKICNVSAETRINKHKQRRTTSSDSQTKRQPSIYFTCSKDLDRVIYSFF